MQNILSRLFRAVRNGDRREIYALSRDPDPAIREAALFVADPVSGIWPAGQVGTSKNGTSQG